MSDAPAQSGSVIRPASRLDGLRPYAPPAVDAGVRLRLDANEGAPCSGRVVSALASIDAEMIRRYPNAATLEQRIAQRWGVSPERVVVTNGGDDAIDRACRAVVEPGRSALLHTPTFEMIGRSVRLAGGAARGVAWLDGVFPTVRFIAAIVEGTALVALVTPNNPTGGGIGQDAIRAVAHSASNAGAMTLVDLAYAEFADEDPTAALLDLPDAVLVRTFSKAMGLAGLRVGYAIASPEVAGWLRTVGGPYPVSSISLALAGASLDDEAGRDKVIERVRAERSALSALMECLGASPLPSQANFITARFTNAPGVWRALRERRVSVRAFPGREDIGDCLRITLPGDESDFERLTTALKEALT